jgi:hypothetical protein
VEEARKERSSAFRRRACHWLLAPRLARVTEERIGDREQHPITRVARDLPILSSSTVTPFGPVIVQASTGESCGGAAQSNMQYCDLTFTTAQNRTITATYNGSASLNPSTSSSVTVPVFDFGLSVSPSSQTVGGKKASFGLTVNAANGSGAMIALECSGGPPNGTCAVSPASVTLSSPTTAAKATVSFPNNTASGTYQLTFTARFGTVVRTATASVTVK